MWIEHPLTIAITVLAATAAVFGIVRFARLPDEPIRYAPLPQDQHDGEAIQR